MNSRDLAITASSLRRRLDPYLSTSREAEDWAQADLLALAWLARQELSRAYECDAEIVYKTLDDGLHPLVRIKFGGAAFDVDLAADRFGHDPVRVAAVDRLYSEAPDATPFVSVDTYNASYAAVAEVLERAGIAMDARDGAPDRRRGLGRSLGDGDA